MERKIRLILSLAFLFFSILSYSQYNWKLITEKDGIRVYESPVSNSNFKSIKVQCTFEGSYEKLMAILNNVERHKDWVYNNKTSYLVKRISPHEFYYYAETYIPWPMSNRDAIMHLKMQRDADNRFLKVVATAVPNYLPEKDGKVRVRKSLITWYVTMASAKTINITYIFEADPGGSLPAWLVNMFADKGAYESFKKLSSLLRK